MCVGCVCVPGLELEVIVIHHIGARIKLGIV